MSVYNVLPWQGEHSLSGFPFDVELDTRDFIVDAQFIQFEGFTPTLNHIYVEYDRIKLSMTFDYGTQTSVELLKAAYDRGDSYRSLHIYTPARDRYLGTLTFGAGALTLWESYTGQKISYNSQFTPSVVRSIPLMDAVYTLDSSYGDVTLGRTEADSTIFYNVSENLNALTFNAVTGHSVPDDAKPVGLRKINLVTPLHNNINLASNDVIKIASFNSQSLTVNLVSGNVSKAFSIPSLVT